MPTQKEKYSVGMAGEHFVVAEIKSSPQKEWIVGNVVPQATAQPWVFVHVPANGAPLRYFVLTAGELNDILSTGDAKYRAGFLERHGKPFTGKGVVKLKLTEAEKYENKWSSIIDQVS